MVGDSDATHTGGLYVTHIDYLAAIELDYNGNVISFRYNPNKTVYDRTTWDSFIGYQNHTMSYVGLSMSNIIDSDALYDLVVDMIPH